MSPVRFVHLGGDLLIAPWRQEWQPTPVFLPGEFHGQRRLAVYSPWVESDMTEEVVHARAHTHTHTHTQD